MICSASVRPHWLREFTTWSRREWHAQIVETTSEMVDPAADLIVCSYATARAPAIHRQLMARQFDVLILDEVQNLRTASAQQTRAVYGRRGDGADALLERADHCWGLSGSIAPNGWARELYTHLRASGVTKLTPQGFDHRFHVLKPTPWGDVPVAHRNMAELKELLREVYLRRRVEEVAPDLPALTVVTTPIEADTTALLEAEDAAGPRRAARRARRRRRRRGAPLLEHASGDAVARLRHGTACSRCRARSPCCAMSSRPTPRHKVVVFGVHRAVIRGLAEGLADFGAVSLEGATRPPDRQAAIDRFATDPTCRAFVAQVVAGGIGISLVAAHHVVMVESSWAIADNARRSPAAGASVRPARYSPATCTYPARSTRRSPRPRPQERDGRRAGGQRR